MRRNSGIKSIMYCIRVSFVILSIVTFGSPRLPVIFNKDKHCKDDLPIPGRSCVPAPLTLYERLRFLHHVNNFRNLVAGDTLKWHGKFLGHEIEQGIMRNLSGGASDMDIMHWDEDLAQKAQKWANKCETTPNGRDGCQVKGDVYATFHLEVNYAGPNQNYALDQLFLKCIEDKSGFSHIQARGTDLMVGFRCYDAISWGDADEIGCGRVFPCKGKTKLVCSVTPCCWPQAKRFTNGAPRTNCRHSNQGHSARYRNLCAPTFYGRSDDLAPTVHDRSDDIEPLVQDRNDDSAPLAQGGSDDSAPLAQGGSDVSAPPVQPPVQGGSGDSAPLAQGGSDVSAPPVQPPVQGGSGDSAPLAQGGSEDSKPPVQPPVQGGSGDSKPPVQPPVQGRSGDSKPPVQPPVQGRSGDSALLAQGGGGKSVPTVHGRSNDFYLVSISLGVVGAIIVCVLTFLAMRRDQEI